MELNREEIIKSLECCGKNTFSKCTECPMGDAYRFCSQELCTKAFALIKELTEENERLLESLQILSNNINLLKEKEKEKEKEKIDAVRKMQYRLTSDEFYIVADDYDGMQYVDFCAWVEEVAKELLEENK